MFLSNFSLRTSLQKFLCYIQAAFDASVHHPAREMRKLAIQETVDYIRTHMPHALSFYTDKELLRYAMQQISVEGYMLELGVYKGGSINYLAKCMPSQKIHGFDSFEGLPESWSGHSWSKGTFSIDGRLPSVRKNVALHKGWFHETLPQWLKKYSGPISFMHVDCDLYSSSKTIFDLIGSRLTQGSIIVFDEYFGYPNWQAHEFKAFKEFVETYDVRYQYIGYSRIQVALQILSLNIRAV